MGGTRSERLLLLRKQIRHGYAEIRPNERGDAVSRPENRAGPVLPILRVPVELKLPVHQIHQPIIRDPRSGVEARLALAVVEEGTLRDLYDEQGGSRMG